MKQRRFLLSAFFKQQHVLNPERPKRNHHKKTTTETQIKQSKQDSETIETSTDKNISRRGMYVMHAELLNNDGHIRFDVSVPVHAF